MIRGLDDDDVDHLHEVDTRKVQEERRQKDEELKELNDYRQRVAELQEMSADQKLVQLASLKRKLTEPSQSRSTSQKNLLSSVVKRKAQATSQLQPPEKVVVIQPSAMKLLAVLPGIGDYQSSDDDSEGSSDELDEIVYGKTDLTGRPMIKKKKECDE